MTRIDGVISAYMAQTVYRDAAPQVGSTFAQIMAKLSTGSVTTTQKSDGIYHSQSIAGQSYPTSDAPDYSDWDKEEAYSDILKRYNLLNILSKEKAESLGLGQAYQQMRDEINEVLYGGDPVQLGMSIEEIWEIDDDIQQRLNRKAYCELYGITSDSEYERLFKQDIMSMYDANNFNTGRAGGLSDDVQIYQILSRFDLTDQKTSLIGTMSGRAAMAGVRFRGADSGISVSDYLNLNDANALLQYQEKRMSDEAYEYYKAWNNLMRALYGIN